MKRTLSAVLLATTVAFTGACSGSQSGDSFDDNQTDQAPGLEADDPEDVREEGETGGDTDAEEAD